MQQNARLCHIFSAAAVPTKVAEKHQQHLTHLIFSLVDVNWTYDCERFLGFEIKRPRLVHLSLQPITNRAVLAFK